MDKIIISSLQNPVVKLVKELQNKKSARKKHGMFVVEGLRGVKEIPSGEGIVKYIVTTEKLFSDIPEHLLYDKCLIVTEEVFSKISETKSPQGMMAVVNIPSYDIDKLKLNDGNYIILENLQDPGNLGTIIRSAHAFNFKGILLSNGCVDPFCPKTVRSTMSSLFYLPIITDCDVKEYIDAFKNKKVPVYVTALNDNAVKLSDMKFQGAGALIIGNEGNGVSDYCIKNADKTMIIPMPGGAESLNASVAAAICMYEMSI